MTTSGSSTAGSSTGASAVLVHILNADRTTDYRSAAFPFLQAMLRSWGWEVRWWTLGVRQPELPEGGGSAFVYSLDDADLQAVLDALDEARPRLVLLNQRLSESQWTELRDRYPDTRFRMTADGSARPPLEQVFGGSELVERIDDLSARIEELVVPDYERHPLNDLAREIHPFHHLVVGPDCVYQRSLAGNPRYANVDLSGCEREWGCSFCSNLDPAPWRPKTSPVELAIRQLQAAEQTAVPELRRREFNVSGVALWHRLAEFLPRLMAIELSPTSLYFSVRIDELLAAETTLDTWLPRLAERGHRICLWNTGLENFSPPENERFNKGLSSETIARGIRTLRRLESDYPQTFVFSELGGFGVIMFTPWTRLDDLRANIQAVREHGIEFSGLFLASSLQLLPNRPITRLAEHDRLTTDRFDDHRFDSGCLVDWNSTEVPWRFRHPDTARVFRVSRRMAREKDAEPRDEEEAAIAAWMDRRFSEGRRPIDLFESLIDAVEVTSDQTPLRDLLDAVTTRLPPARPAQSSSTPDAGSPEPPPRRWLVLGERLRSALSSTEATRRQVRMESARARIQSGRGGVDLTLVGESKRLRLWIEERDDAAPALLRGERLALSYSELEGTEPHEERTLFRQLLALAERLDAEPSADEIA